MFTTTIIDDLHDLAEDIETLLDELNELSDEYSKREQIISLLK